ncbi:ImuA family protein [Pedobacter africanus]|uniref:Protein ImuA n=1 Tax=Pedobacter africanus TaxID=151894 RepID=A0A1W2DHJ3_9SPHI|nr:Error-prone repair protein ImuA [Pedobacter africanus]SMC97001.1 protein ImuA [Pedobacter africanus]
MEQLTDKNRIIQKLQQDILLLQGLVKYPGNPHQDMGLGPIQNAFPGQVFPTAAVHEFISDNGPDCAATNGFISGLLGKLMDKGGTCVWISTNRSLFPSALPVFNILPERIIFVELYRQKDALWAIEEALKCKALTAVVGEIKELSFTESRRLQLAVEKSKVTGFIHRHQPTAANAVACTTRWKISPLPSILPLGMPGIGIPSWNVELLKVKNGQPGKWQVEWFEYGFRHHSVKEQALPEIQKLKAG